eukprot:6654190-Pyramimonas_sp.AAC.1
MRKVFEAARPAHRGQVTGLAGAVRLSLGRVGWAAESRGARVTDRGESIDLKPRSPKMVRTLVEQGVRGSLLRT